MPQIIKDFVFNVQSYLHWLDDYRCEGEWTCIKNMNNHLERIRELLPQVLDLVRDSGFDDNCG